MSEWGHWLREWTWSVQTAQLSIPRPWGGGGGTGHYIHKTLNVLLWGWRHSEELSEEALDGCPEDPLLWIQGTPFYQLSWGLFHAWLHLQSSQGIKRGGSVCTLSRNSPRLTCLLPELAPHLPAAGANITAWYGTIPLVAGQRKTKMKTRYLQRTGPPAAKQSPAKCVHLLSVTGVPQLFSIFTLHFIRSNLYHIYIYIYIYIYL